MSKPRVSIGRSLLAFAVLFFTAAFLGCNQEKAWYYDQPRALDAGGPLARIAAEETFSFVVIGDTRTGIKIFQKQIDEINRLDGIIRNLLEFARPPKPQMAACSLRGVSL